jgi:uncharacterized membrane protein
MTKRDIADIVLVWMAVSFILVLLTSILTLGSIIGMPDEQSKFMTTSVALVFQVLHLLAVAFLIYILLFKRNLVLNIVFPDAEGKEVSVSDGLTALTSYVFWIRLLGIFTLLSSGIGFFADLVSGLAMNRQFVIDSFWKVKTFPHIVSAILAFVVIWKADWIANRLERIGSSNKPDAGAG